MSVHTIFRSGIDHLGGANGPVTETKALFRSIYSHFVFYRSGITPFITPRRQSPASAIRGRSPRPSRPPARLPEAFGHRLLLLGRKKRAGSWFQPSSLLW